MLASKSLWTLLRGCFRPIAIKTIEPEMSRVRNLFSHNDAEISQAEVTLLQSNNPLEESLAAFSAAPTVACARVQVQQVSFAELWRCRVQYSSDAVLARSSFERRMDSMQFRVYRTDMTNGETLSIMARTPVGPPGPPPHAPHYDGNWPDDVRGESEDVIELERR